MMLDFIHIQKKSILIIAFFCASFACAQVTCPTLNGPFNGDVDVAVDTAISWTPVVGAPGYLISIGTTPGGSEIINNRNTGSATSFQPPLGLPDDSSIYISLTIFFFNAENIACTTETFRTIDVTTPPTCTTVKSPVDEATNINVASAISWDYAPTAKGYRMTIGTTMGGGEILNDFDVGNVLSYKPTLDLPFSTEIFIRIIPYNDNGSTPGICSQFSFTTGILATIPGCTNLVSPLNGSINVPLTPQLEWAVVPDAEGYLVTIGMTPDTAEVLDNLVFTTNSTLVLEFDPNRTFFITVIPFNDAGEALGCIQETFSTVLGCGPYLDSVTGELIDLAPEINFPDEVSFCQNEIPYTVSTTDTAEGYRWYKIDTNGNETLISSTTETNLSTTGVYRYEAYNFVSQSGNTVECSNSKEFTVVSSEIATITSLDTSGLNGSFQIAIQVTGNGDYEFALDQIDGPYQNSNIFSGLSSGSYTVYVRDKNGCGIVEDSIIQDLTLEGFPNFFSPNGDGINDYWQFIPPVDTGEINVGAIYIFDRYGNLIKQIDPLALGWNGQINGAPMPASDYWFTAISLTTQKKIKGHFALKR